MCGWVGQSVDVERRESQRVDEKMAMTGPGGGKVAEENIREKDCDNNAVMSIIFC